MHLFLYGSSGLGKSTLLRQALAQAGICPQGFATFKGAPMAGSCPLYMGSASLQRPPLPQVPLQQPLSQAGLAWMQVGICGKPGQSQGFPEVFDHLGCELLQHIPAGSTVLMDELGFMEAQAFKFQRQVLKTLDQPCQVLGVIKEKDTAFLAALRQHPLVRTLALRPDNGSEVNAVLKAFLAQPTLAKSFAVKPGQTIALSGGGGKTTLLYLLGRELAAAGHKVILTTTTRIYPPLPQQVQQLLLAPQPAQIQAALQHQNLIMIANPPNSGKLLPPKAELLRLLPQLADFLLIEADGSKGRPLKTPAAYEPAIPAQTDLVIALAGLSALGQSIENACHRPYLAASLLRQPLHHLLTAEDMAGLMFHPLGLLQGVPPGADLILVINQAEIQPNAALAVACCLKQLGAHRVLITSLLSPVPVRHSLS